jgi:hypothetical protein
VGESTPSDPPETAEPDTPVSESEAADTARTDRRR